MNFVKTTSCILAIMLASLFSCTDTKKVDDSKSIKTVNGLKSVKDKVVGEFGADKLVYSTTIMAKDHMNDEFMYAGISFLENGIDMTQDLTMLPEEKTNPAKSKTLQNTIILKNKQGAVALKDLNFEEIASKVKQAEAMIPVDYEDFHLYRWVYSVDNDNKIT
ncbi:MAG: hypothetical protein EOP00_18070, partial [Pedobacter sp.]